MHLVARLRQQIRATADPALAELPGYPAPDRPARKGHGHDAMAEPARAAPLQLRVGDVVLCLISTTTVFGARSHPRRSPAPEPSARANGTATFFGTFSAPAGSIPASRTRGAQINEKDQSDGQHH